MHPGLIKPTRSPAFLPPISFHYIPSTKPPNHNTLSYPLPGFVRMAHPTSPLPTLLYTEAVLKVLDGTMFIVSPTTVLKNLTTPPYTPTSISLIQNLGTQTLAFSIPLFLASYNTSTARASRKLVYYTVLAREGFLALELLGRIAWREDGEEVESVRALEWGERKRGEAMQMERENRAILRRGLWM
ncbi:hypothetical protein K469DRAFT_707519 [Zopfia rhizophila CBS 207.26]|uniref:Uncharacterized protein n=1 Tax=Zopfia rhizophila CBS 207.26 TaxID=1314779 RepID=A0A6A6E6N9_9PEZI|nr:hypothetical protein K469DRAFT_707519 [Zopfia rhizophila CBS 207.26]